MRGMDGEPQRPSARSDRFLAHRGLIALCCGTAMAEAFLLIVVAPAARALAPQVSALPPLAIFHDLRWLYSTERSWLWFALLPAVLLIALPLSHAGLAGTWWRTLPPASAAWWLLAEFAVLTAAAALSTALPPPDAVPIAGLAGLVNARAWYGLTAAIARVAGQADAEQEDPALARTAPAVTALAQPAPAEITLVRPGLVAEEPAGIALPAVYRV